MATYPQVLMDVPEDYNGCFGCGRANPIGLKLKFAPEGGGVRTVFTPDDRYQGWPGYVHGGIIGCLLDEAMSYAAIFQGVRCVTARLEYRLKRLTPIDQPLTITGHVTRKTRKVIECRATVALADGSVMAEGTATHFVIGPSSGQVGAQRG